MNYKGTHQEFFREQNLKLVLQQVFNHQQTSRIEISKQLELNKSTISSLYNELNKNGYFLTIGEGDSSKAGGRKPQLISFNKHYAHTINFDIGYNHLRIMENFITGEFIRYEKIPLTQRTLASILEMIHEQIQISKANTQSVNGLAGIGISNHGIVFNNKIMDSPFIEINDIDLVAHLEETYNIPVIVENEANLTAIYVRDFFEEFQNKNILSISIHKGIGAGIVLDNTLYKGLNGTAGEIGRALITGQHGPTEMNRKVEDLCSEDAFIATVQAKKQQLLDKAAIIRLLNNNDEELTDCVTEFVYNISKVIYNASVAYATDIICIASPIIEQVPRLQERILAILKERSVEYEIMFLTSDLHPSLYGSCSLITHKILDLEGFELKFNRHSLTKKS